jgi:uncharacterized protein
MCSLLDVNFLIALLDSKHEAHVTALSWFSQNSADGWATCPITENGLVRILANPKYPGGVSVSKARTLLRAIKQEHHEFWFDDISLTETSKFEAEDLVGYLQVTDCYLLGLAVKHGGRLVTFDQSIRLAGVVGAKQDHLLVLRR